MSVKPISVLFVAVILCSGIVLGQDTSSKSVNSLVTGAKALQFEINRNFDLSSFQGSTISYKIQRSPHSATRIGLSLAATVDNNERNSRRNSGAISETESDRSFFSIGVTAQRIFYSQPTRRISFFWGLGPTVGYFGDNLDSEDRSTSAGGLPPFRVRFTNTSNKRWNVGASVVAGVELFVYKSISLLAEYGSVLRYNWSKQKRKTESITDGVSSGVINTDTVTNSFGLRAQSVKFGLSAYFGN